MVSNVSSRRRGRRLFFPFLNPLMYSLYGMVLLVVVSIIFLFRFRFFRCDCTIGDT